MGCFRLVIMGGGFIPTPQRSQALLHLRRWNFTCTCIWPIFSEYVKKDSILLPEIILDNRRQYLWNPLADFFVSYIFEIYSSRRKFWVLLEVCTTLRSKFENLSCSKRPTAIGLDRPQGPEQCFVTCRPMCSKKSKNCIALFLNV